MCETVLWTHPVLCFCMFTVVASLPLMLNKSSEIISLSKTKAASGIWCLATNLQRVCVFAASECSVARRRVASVQSAQVSAFSSFHLCRIAFTPQERSPGRPALATDVYTYASACLCHIIFNIHISKIIHNRIKQTLEGEMCAGGAGVKHLCSLSSLESFSRPVFTEAYRMCLMFPWQRKR